MSNSANSFFENAAQQPEFDQKIAAILTDSALSPADQAEELAKLARAHGSELTAADFRAAQSEISEDELADVAGGRNGGFSDKYWEKREEPDGSFTWSASLAITRHQFFQHRSTASQSFKGMPGEAGFFFGRIDPDLPRNRARSRQSFSSKYLRTPRVPKEKQRRPKVVAMDLPQPI
jgi:hypothetical protein